MAPKDQNSFDIIHRLKDVHLRIVNLRIAKVQGSPESDPDSDVDREHEASTNRRGYAVTECLTEMRCVEEVLDSIEAILEDRRRSRFDTMMKRDNEEVKTSTLDQGVPYSTLRKYHGMSSRNHRNNASPLLVCVLVGSNNGDNLPIHFQGHTGIRNKKQSQWNCILQDIPLKEEDVVIVGVVDHPSKKHGLREEHFGHHGKKNGRREEHFGHTDKENSRGEEYFGHTDKKNGLGEEHFGDPEKKNGRGEEYFGHTEKTSGRREEHFGDPEKKNGRSGEHFGHPEKEDCQGKEHFGNHVQLLVLRTLEISFDEESDKFINIRGKGERVGIRSLTDGCEVVALWRPQVEVVLNSGPSTRQGQISEGPPKIKGYQDQNQHTDERRMTDPEDCHGDEDDDDQDYFARMAEAYKTNFCEETADLFSGTMEAGRWDEIVTQFKFTKSKADQLFSDSVSALKQKASEAYDSQPHHTSPPETLFRLQEVLVREAVLALAKQCREQNGASPQAFGKK